MQNRSEPPSRTQFVYLTVCGIAVSDVDVTKNLIVSCQLDCCLSGLHNTCFLSNNDSGYELSSQFSISSRFRSSICETIRNLWNNNEISNAVSCATTTSLLDAKVLTFSFLLCLYSKTGCYSICLIMLSPSAYGRSCTLTHSVALTPVILFLRDGS